jgi:hypothetical protein
MSGWTFFIGMGNSFDPGVMDDEGIDELMIDISQTSVVRSGFCKKLPLPSFSSIPP